MSARDHIQLPEHVNLFFIGSINLEFFALVDPHMGHVRSADGRSREIAIVAGDCTVDEKGNLVRPREGCGLRRERRRRAVPCAGTLTPRTGAR